MRFVPKQPVEGVNVSKTHPLVEASTLLIGLSAIFALIAVSLVFLVEIALYFVPPEAEKRLFHNWIPEDLETVSPANAQLESVQELVDGLARRWPNSPYQFTVEIHDTDEANAFAFPGGLIIVTQGLLDEVESENELAFVLSHELGHYRNRDHLRALGRGAVLSIFFAATWSGGASEVGLRVADLTLRGFSRRQESEADAYALSLVQSRYGHVGESWRLFERWQDQREGDTPGVWAYLSTHPGSADRIEAMLELSDREAWPTEGDVSPLPWMATPETSP